VPGTLDLSRGYSYNHHRHQTTRLQKQTNKYWPRVVPVPVAQSPAIGTADGRFDWILRETIYSEQAARTRPCLSCVAEHTAGVAFIATKRYYFGVGGGSAALPFRRLCMRRRNRNNITNRTLRGTDTSASKVETVRVHDNGTGNIREILSVQVCHRELLDIDNIGDSIIRSVNP
jgi:hypothetical protein